jgi:transposase
MAKALSFTVKENTAALKKLYKEQPLLLRPRVLMLLEVKKSDVSLSKNELAELVGVNHNSIQSWRRLYLQGGLSLLLKHNRGGKRREVITPVMHKAIEKKLTNSTAAFHSFTQMQQWLDNTYLKGIKYVTLHAYVKKHFGAKLKVARKSHIHKSEEAVSTFKKNGRPVA